MKFCSDKIQNHLLNGGEITRKNEGIFNYRSIKLIDNILRFADGNHAEYIMDSVDLTADDWEIVEAEYNWDKIIQDEILCVFSDDKDFKDAVISTLHNVDEHCTAGGIWYKYCKPFNPADFNIAGNIEEYKK